MESDGVEKLLAQGVTEPNIEVVATADMRYLDQIYEVNVAIPDWGQNAQQLVDQWASNFHRRYQELYSYNQSEQEIRLVTLRVSVVGRLPKLDPPPLEDGNGAQPKEKGWRRIYFGGWVEAPVYEITDLSPGNKVNGPAVLESKFTTVLVEPGDSATVDPYGGIELSVSLESSPIEVVQIVAAGKPDPVTLAVVEHRLESIAMEMTEVMLRTAMSQILNSSRDFSTAILDGDCQLVPQGEGLSLIHI